MYNINKLPFFHNVQASNFGIISLDFLHRWYSESLSSHCKELIIAHSSSCWHCVVAFEKPLAVWYDLQKYFGYVEKSIPSNKRNIENILIVLWEIIFSVLLAIIDHKLSMLTATNLRISCEAVGASAKWLTLSFPYQINLALCVCSIACYFVTRV